MVVLGLFGINSLKGSHDGNISLGTLGVHRPSVMLEKRGVVDKAGQVRRFGTHDIDGEWDQLLGS